MTSSRRGRASFGWLLAAWLLCGSSAWAALGQPQSSIEHERAQLHARSTVSVRAQYTVHATQLQDGSRIRQYVGADGTVFAVHWAALHKPDLSSLLGASYPRYASALQDAGKRSPILRNFHHSSLDLEVQASGHLHVFTGYAYHPSKLPAGFDLASLGQE